MYVVQLNSILQTIDVNSYYKAISKLRFLLLFCSGYTVGVVWERETKKKRLDKPGCLPATVYVGREDDSLAKVGGADIMGNGVMSVLSTNVQFHNCERIRFPMMQPPPNTNAGALSSPLFLSLVRLRNSSPSLYSDAS